MILNDYLGEYSKSLTLQEILENLLGKTCAKKEGFNALLQDMTHNPRKVLASLEHAEKNYGLTQNEALRLSAAFTLVNRFQTSPVDDILINGSQIAAQIFRPLLQGISNEKTYVLPTRSGRKFCDPIMISTGGLNYTIVDVRLTMNTLLAVKATGFIFAHNHPSGALSPSESDRKLTRKLVEAGKILDIQLTDHIIIPGHGMGYYSFTDNGEIQL